MFFSLFQIVEKNINRKYLKEKNFYIKMTFFDVDPIVEIS